MNEIEVSIIIVNYNTADMLRNCLKSIHEKTKRVSFEIIVVDNASKDGSVDMVRSEFPDVKLLASTENNGFSRGNNLAFPLVEGHYIFYLNPDTILLNDAVSILHEFLQTHSDAGFAGPRLYMNLEKKHHPTIRSFTTPTNILFRHLPGYRPFKSLYERLFVRKNKLQMVDWLMGAALMGPTQLLKDAGGFDEVFFMYSDEEDLSRRLSQKGKYTYYIPESEIVHFWGGSSQQEPTITNKFFWDSQMKYLLRYYNPLRVRIFVKVFSAILTIKSLTGSAKRKPKFDQIRDIINSHCP